MEDGNGIDVHRQSAPATRASPGRGLFEKGRVNQPLLPSSSSGRGLPANGPSVPSDEMGVNCMADYQPLLTRAIANLASASTWAARHAVYQQARKAQWVQLRTQDPPLRERDIASEEAALEDAIDLVEAKFGGADASLAGRVIVTGNPPAVPLGASEKLLTARTEALIPRAYKPAQIGPQRAGPEKSGTWLRCAPTAALAGLLAVVLGAVLAVAGAAMVMRHTPQDLKGAPLEALQEPPAEQQPTKITERAQASLTESSSTAPLASAPQPPRQRGAEPANSDAGCQRLRVACHCPSCNDNRLRRSAAADGQPWKDGVVNDPACTWAPRNGRSKCRRRHSRSQDAR